MDLSCYLHNRYTIKLLNIIILSHFVIFINLTDKFLTNNYIWRFIKIITFNLL